MSKIWPQRTCPSITRLMEIKDVTEEDAKAIRHAWHSIARRKDARAKIDTILRTHGVEFLGIHKRTDHDVYYCNAGDTYATTIIFIGPNMRVGCWGDLVEKKLVRDPNQL